MGKHPNTILVASLRSVPQSLQTIGGIKILLIAFMILSSK